MFPLLKCLLLATSPSCGNDKALNAHIEAGDDCNKIESYPDHYRHLCTLSAKNFKGTGKYSWNVSNVKGNSECGHDWVDGAFSVSGDTIGITTGDTQRATVTMVSSILRITRSHEQPKCQYTVTTTRKQAEDQDATASEASEIIRATL